MRTFCPHLGSFFVLFLLSLHFGQISPLAFFRWFTTTSDRNAESCNRIPSNYCLGQKRGAIKQQLWEAVKQNFIVYRSSKVSWRPDCIFEVHQLWQSGFSRVYSNCCCSCSFEPEIIKIGQWSHSCIAIT